jgi:glycosyltransferase involved in cell wall biosynthesis
MVANTAVLVKSAYPHRTAFLEKSRDITIFLSYYIRIILAALFCKMRAKKTITMQSADTLYRKKILFIVTKSVWGGAQRYVFDIATHLPKQEYDVAVIMGGTGPLFKKLHDVNIRSIAVPSLDRNVRIFSDIAVFFRLLFLFFKEKPNIIHLNSSKIGGIGAIAARIYNAIRSKKNPRVRVIFTAHGWAFNEDRPRTEKRMIVWLSRIASFFQDRIIIISRFDLDSALREKFEEQKLVFISNAIPESQNFLSPLDAQRELSGILGTRLERPLIGVIAELTKNKGLLYLIQALLLLKRKGVGFLCIILGEGEDRGRLSHMIEKNGLSKNVILGGFVENASRYLKAFDFFLLPSIKEGLPYVLLEALAAEIPLIGTIVGGIPDIIEHNTNGLLVPSKNPAKLADAVQLLIESKELREKFSSHSEKKVRSFSFEKMMNATVRAYTS